MKQLMKQFDECLNTWVDLPKYVYTEKYRKAFMEFARNKQELGQSLKPTLAVMTLHHETGNKCPYFEFDRNMDIKKIKHSLINIHLNLVKEGKYDIARCVLKALIKKRNDMIEPLEMILERVGYKIN